MSVSRINELSALIKRYEEYYKGPETANQLCRTANMTQMAEYKKWREELDMLIEEENEAAVDREYEIRREWEEVAAIAEEWVDEV